MASVHGTLTGRLRGESLIRGISKAELWCFFVVSLIKFFFYEHSICGWFETPCSATTVPVSAFTEKVNRILAKPTLNFSDALAKSTFLVEAVTDSKGTCRMNLENIDQNGRLFVDHAHRVNAFIKLWSKTVLTLDTSFQCISISIGVKFDKRLLKRW